VLADVGAEQNVVERIGRLGARLVLQQALQDESGELLGRGPCERTERPSAATGMNPRRKDNELVDDTRASACATLSAEHLAGPPSE
jgi:hypothetical protein